MKLKHDSYAHVDSAGRLILPRDVTSHFGLTPGAKVFLTERENGVCFRQPVTRLTKLYVEPTNQCNLRCRTCVRNTWDETPGQMSASTFNRIIKGLKSFPSLSTVLFGGFGEPLFHPRIADMVAQAKNADTSVELITNGTLLTEELSRQLAAAGLDVLWVSLDGAASASYADVRIGAELDEVIANVTCFRNMSWVYQRHLPHIGIIFVAMKRNITELPEVIRIGRKLLADRFMITNVIPYTDSLCAEVLYDSVLTNLNDVPSPWLPQLTLSKIDSSEMTREPLYLLARGWQGSHRNTTITGNSNNYCPFIESGSTAICWDGNMSPCLPLLHSHSSFVNRRQRTSQCHVVGNVNDNKLCDLWNAPDYVAFRERVQAFAFSPCTFCGGCDLSETNEEDCFGNTFPTCGGCLWAQGVIRCP